MKLSLATLSKFDFLGVFFLRLGAGALIAYNGFPLLIGGADAYERIGSAVSLVGIHSFHLLFGLASAVIQSVGGLFLILGILTRGIALLLAIVTSFATASVFLRSGIELSFFVHLQLALLFFALVFIGPGRLSLDRKGI